MKKLLFFCSIITSIANAAPSQEAIDKIESTYNPKLSNIVEKDVTNILELCTRKDIEFMAQDPVNLKSKKTKLTTFVSRFSESRASELKTVLIIPPTGGANILDWSYAAHLCLNDFRVAVLTAWDFDNSKDKDLEVHERSALRMLAAIRHSVEYLKPIRPKQLGLLGTSVGANLGAFATSYDARISAAALIVGGAGTKEIIARSTETHLAELREWRMKNYNYATVDDYEKALSPYIKFDVLDFINYSGPKDIWMMIATEDDMVPTANQWKLFKAYGSPKGSLMYKDSHVETIKHTAFAETGTIVDFFKRVLQ